MPKKGYKQTQEHKDKSRAGRANGAGFKHSRATKDKMSEAAIRRGMPKDFWANLPQNQKGRAIRQESIDKRKATLESRGGGKCKPGCDCRKHQGIKRRHCAADCTCKRHSPEIREFNRQKTSATEFQKLMRDGRKKWHSDRKLFKPNKLERRVEAYLDEHFPSEWKFNNGDFVISGFFPDFVNINGQKALIEVFGDYFHRGENPNRKKTIYRNCGFACVVIWEHEFNQNPEYLGELIASL